MVVGTEIYYLLIEVLEQDSCKSLKTDTDDFKSHGSGVVEKRWGREDEKAALRCPPPSPMNFLQVSYMRWVRAALNQRDSRSNVRSVTGNILINR